VQSFSQFSGEPALIAQANGAIVFIERQQRLNHFAEA
jgi:hypothetical protein